MLRLSYLHILLELIRSLFLGVQLVLREGAREEARRPLPAMREASQQRSDWLDLSRCVHNFLSYPSFDLIVFTFQRSTILRFSALSLTTL